MEDGCYERVGEEFEERVYPQEVLETMLAESGLRVEAVFGEDSFAPPGEQEQRLIYIAKKQTG